jgi:hypothetical protein
VLNGRHGIGAVAFLTVSLSPHLTEKRSTEALNFSSQGAL